MTPAGTPANLIDKLHRETGKALTMSDVHNKLEDLGLDVIGNSPAEFSAIIKSETPQWAKVIKAARRVISCDS
jgi:tripartite-type tricarboxylate transporter receptor subunit TctC